MVTSFILVGGRLGTGRDGAEGVKGSCMVTSEWAGGGLWRGGAGRTKDHTCGGLSKLQILEAGVQHKGPPFLVSVSPHPLNTAERVSKRACSTASEERYGGEGLVGKARVSQGHSTKGNDAISLIITDQEGSLLGSWLHSFLCFCVGLNFFKIRKTDVTSETMCVGAP